MAADRVRGMKGLIYLLDGCRELEVPQKRRWSPTKSWRGGLLSCLWQHEVKGRILTTEVGSLLSPLTLRTNMLDWRLLP